MSCLDFDANLISTQSIIWIMSDQHSENSLLNLDIINVSLGEQTQAQKNYLSLAQAWMILDLKRF